MPAKITLCGSAIAVAVAKVVATSASRAAVMYTTDAIMPVLANETSVPTLKEAINQGFDRLYDESHRPEDVAAQIIVDYSKRPGAAGVH